MRLNRKMTAGHVLLLLLIWQAAAVPDGQAGSCYHANGTIKFGGFDTAAYGCDPPEPPPETTPPGATPPEATPARAAADALHGRWAAAGAAFRAVAALELSTVFCVYVALLVLALLLEPWSKLFPEAMAGEYLRRMEWATVAATLSFGAPRPAGFRPLSPLPIQPPSDLRPGAAAALGASSGSPGALVVGYAVFLLGAILLGPGVSARVDRVPPFLTSQFYRRAVKLWNFYFSRERKSGGEW